MLVSLALHAIAALLLIRAVTHQQGAPLPKNAVTVITLQSLLPATPGTVAETPQPAPPRPKFHPRQTLAKAAPSPATHQMPPAPQAVPAPPVQAVATAPPAPAAVPAPDPAPAIVAQASASTQPDAAPPIAYLLEVSRVIRINLNYPAQAHQHGIAVVHIRIARDGTVLSAGVVQSSGTAELDREAREVVLRIHRFPEPPSAYVSAIGDFSIDQPVRFLG